MSKVLVAIDDGCGYGYKIAKTIRMSHGTIYSVLNRLLRDEWVTVVDGFTDAGLPCRWYEVHPGRQDSVAALRR